MSNQPPDDGGEWNEVQRKSRNQGKGPARGGQQQNMSGGGPSNRGGYQTGGNRNTDLPPRNPGNQGPPWNRKGPSANRPWATQGSGPGMNTAPTNQTGTLLTNHFEVILPQHKNLHRYRVLLEKTALKTPGFRRKVFRAAIEHLRTVLVASSGPSAVVATDGREYVIFEANIAKPTSKFDGYRSCYPDPNDTSSEAFYWNLVAVDGTQYHYILTGREMIDFPAFEQFTQSGTTADMSVIDCAIAAFNLIASWTAERKSIASGDIIKIGKKFYRIPYPDDLCNAIIGRQGYFFTLKPGNGKPLLNLNARYGPFFKAQLVSRFDIDKHLLYGLRVIVLDEKQYGSESPPTETDLDALVTAQQVFEADGLYGEGRVIGTVPNKVGGFDVRVRLDDPVDPSVPTPVLASNQLFIRPYQRCPFGTLPADVNAEMISKACTPPEETLKRIGGGLAKLGFIPDVAANQPTSLTAFNIAPQSRLLEVAYRKSGNVVLQYSTPTRSMVNNASWNLSQKKFLDSQVSITRPIFVLVDSRLRNASDDWSKQLRDTVLSQFKENTNRITYTFGEPDRIRHRLINITKLEQELDTAAKADPALIVLLAKDKSLQFYRRFKHSTDQKYGFRSLYIQGEKLLRMNPRLFGNIGLKLNLKFAHTNHTLFNWKAPIGALNNKGKTSLMVSASANEIPVGNWFLKLISEQILGADVDHPGPGTDLPSVAALVGSVDERFGLFLGSAHFQRARKEIIDLQPMKRMAVQRLEAWKSKNKALPTHLLYYRDGVGDSQYNDVLTQEVAGITAAFHECAGKNAAALQITVAIVTKRHQTRFFTKQQKNPQPGTVVTEQVTAPDATTVGTNSLFDFFLQSHTPVKGTAKPTYYRVIRNDVGFEDKQLQDFTFQLCHTYVRSTTSVSYAPPAYYADRLCDRVRKYIQNENGRLNTAAPKPPAPRQSQGESSKAPKGGSGPAQKGANGPAKKGESSSSKKDEKPARPTKDELDARAEAAARDWESKDFDIPPDKKSDCGPWHKNLDGYMFWM